MTRMERVSVSNLAWPEDEDAAGVALAAELGFAGIELAPRKVFGPWDNIDPAAVKEYRRRLADAGLAIPAFQAILFGVDGAQLFGAAGQSVMRQHLAKVVELATQCGAKALVYGAPKTRDPGTRSTAEAMTEAGDFLVSIAEIFAASNVSLCVEANTADWGCRFVTTTAEAVDLVERVDRPGIRLQLDTGTIITAGESLDIITTAAPLAGHFHASSPQMAPIAEYAEAQTGIAHALQATNYQAWRSVEMKAVGDWRSNLRAAAELMRREYRS